MFTSGGDLKWPAAIAVDWDGYDSGDNWDAHAIIHVGGNIEYSDTSTTAAAGDYDDSPGNYASHRIYRITPCHGDMNNDGTINSFDIDPFVAAFVDGNSSGIADYYENYPGLEGSAHYHGDMNCDDAFNNFDIDSFVDVVINDPGCCECAGGCSLLRGGGEESFSGGGDAPPGVVHGEAIRTYVTDEDRLSAWIALIETYATNEPENEYWADMLVGLTDE